MRLSLVVPINLIVILATTLSVSAVEFITIYQPLGNPVPPPNDTTWPFNTAAAEFNQTYDGQWAVQIVYASWTQIATYIVTGDPNRGGKFPDVIVVGGAIDNFVRAQSVVPLTSYLNAWAAVRPDGDITKDIARASSFAYFVQDEWYALPIALDLRPFFYRVDLYQKYLNKTTPPSTWDELVSNSLQIQALAKARDNVTYYGFVAPHNASDWATIQWFIPTFLSWGAQIATSNFECGLNSPEFRGAVKFWTDLWLNDTQKISPYTGNLTYSDYMFWFGDGKVIHWNDGSWDKAFWGSGWLTQLYACNYDFSTTTNFSTNRFHVAMMKNPRGPRVRAAFSGGTGLAIPTGSKMKDAAMAYIRIFTDPAKSHIQLMSKGSVSPYISVQSLQDTTNPALSAMLCQAPYAYPETFPKSFPEYSKVSDANLIPMMLQQVATGNLTVESATDEACAQMNAIMYPPPQAISYQKPAAIIIVLINALLQVFCLCLVATLFLLRNQPSIQAMDFAMSSTVLFGCIVFLANTYTYIGTLTIPACRSSVFLVTIGSGLILGPCIAKLYRIWTVFEGVGVKKVALRTSTLFSIVGAVTSVELCLAIVWTAIDPPGFVKTTLDSGERTQICRSTSTAVNSGFFWALIAYNAFLLFVGLALAWLSRNAYDRFNESREIAIGFLNILFLGLVWLLMSVATLTQEFQFWIRAAFQMGMVLALVATLYLPRISKALQTRGGTDEGFDFSRSNRNAGSTSGLSSSSTVALKKQQLEKTKTTELLRAECSVLRSSVLGFKRWSTRKLNYMPTLGLLVMDPDTKRSYLGEIFKVPEGTTFSRMEKGEGNEDEPTYCLTIPPVGPQKRTLLFIQFSQQFQASEWESWLLSKSAPTKAKSIVFDGNTQKKADASDLSSKEVSGSHVVDSGI
ncbi:hypothetical protein HDU93_003880 [Gonapodya sp. JEL0774]|nr:hypothetical protein HDU93_003880 [Gonapodya sp. JEL0774]